MDNSSPPKPPLAAGELHIQKLRMSVIDRCDLDCIHCCSQRPRKSSSAATSDLSPVAIGQLFQTFLHLGIRRFSLAGGDLLLRDDVREVLEQIGRLKGIEQLELTTSGVLLAKHAVAVRKAGICELSVNLPSRNPGHYVAISNRKRVNSVLLGLEVAQRQRFRRIRILMNLISGINDQEVESMCMYCATRNFDLRLSNRLPKKGSGFVCTPLPAVDLEAIRRRLMDRYRMVEVPVPGTDSIRRLESTDKFFRVEFDSSTEAYGCSQSLCDAALDSSGQIQLGTGGTFEVRALLAAIKQKQYQNPSSARSRPASADF
jgi:cyclic pyranopterin phosphate synthase